MTRRAPSTPRRIVLGLIVLIMAVFCLVAARKLTTTPNFDRIHEGMTVADLYGLLGASHFEVSRPDAEGVPCFVRGDWELDEGRITVILREDEGEQPIFRKNIVCRGPLERLAWLLGWRPKPGLPVEYTGEERRR